MELGRAKISPNSEDELNPWRDPLVMTISKSRAALACAANVTP